MASDATEQWARNEARGLASVWLAAYEEARSAVMGKGLSEGVVAHCAQLVADEVFNIHLQRLDDGEV